MRSCGDLLHGGGGLRVLNLQSMNMTSLTKLVDMIVGSRDDLVISVLQDSYC